MGRKKKAAKYLAAAACMAAALALMAYPFAANYVFENRADSIVETIEQEAAGRGDEERRQAIKDAREYNHMVASGHIQLKDPFTEDDMEEMEAEYYSLLSMNEDGAMGFISIPAINVNLPIYHGTSADILESGVGHLEGSSLPVGGKSTHAVLTSHSGLSSAKLFTDLTELEEGDVFFLNIFGEKLAYEVDQIKAVLPTELSDLYIQPEEDYCTLITCTPYGVNTHRLLVRGKCTEYKEAAQDPENFAAKKSESQWMAEYRKDLVISLSVFAVCLCLLYIKRHFAGKKTAGKQ